MASLGLVIHKGHSIRLSDLTRHPAAAGFPAHHPPMRRFLGVPIMGKRGVLGDLYLTERLDGSEFTEDDEHIARLLAQKAGAAIENARLHEESARLLEEVQQLQRSRERFFAMVNHESATPWPPSTAGRRCWFGGRTPPRCPVRRSRSSIRPRAPLP
ncbi:MAG: GAF domain-containing protein [Gemmatimonadetes bacterium]|nr:GAF domain-containing protein [Gemmatimonadota bacterium]